MKPLRINTVPGGGFFVIFLSFQTFLWLLTGVFLLPTPAGIGFFILSVAAAFVIFVSALTEYYNVICFSEDCVWHGDEKYTWDAVFVTVTFLPGYKGSHICNLYFDNRYLTEQDCQSKKILKKDFISDILQSAWSCCCDLTASRS